MGCTALFSFQRHYLDSSFIEYFGCVMTEDYKDIKCGDEFYSIVVDFLLQKVRFIQNVQEGETIEYIFELP